MDSTKGGVRGGRDKANGEDVKVDKLKENSLELPKNTKCLMDCEAAEILQGIQDHMVVLSSDADIKIPISFDKGLTYAKRDGSYSKPNTVRQTLELLKKYGLTDFEICMIANIGVVSEDEIFALLPTLKDKQGKIQEALKSALGELSKLKS